MYYLRGWKQLIDRVVVFTGSKRDFEQYLTDNLSKDETMIPFMELIQHYNARLRPNESGVSEAALQKKIYVDNCIVRADDYGSVMSHVLSNFYECCDFELSDRRSLYSESSKTSS